jgi:transcriptional regulator
MYTPGQYRQSDRTEILRLIRSHPFATVITWDESGPFANQLPILVHEDESLLIGHLARANPQARHFEEGRETLVIFHGPHAYISPRWYRAKEHVPTWNYATVQVRGKSHAASASRLREILDESVAKFETGADAYRFTENSNLSGEFQNQLMGAIVGFEIPMTHVDAKFKLGQNRNDEDLAGAIEGLSRRDDDMSRGIRELMLQQQKMRTVK